jgi:hypothetical protein
MRRPLLLSLCVGGAVLALGAGLQGPRARGADRGGPFDGAPLPDFKEWDGDAPPEAKSTQIVLLYAAEKGWNAALLECSEGKTLWSALVPTERAGDLLSDLYKAALVDVGRHPPPPPPSGDDPGRIFQINANAACAGNGPITVGIENFAK